MNYRKMIVWQKAMQLTEAAYMEIRKLPQEELYALSAQMRRAVISILHRTSQKEPEEIPTTISATS